MVILDASAILAYLRNEPGWQTVEPGILNAIARASRVSIAEVASKLIDWGVPPDGSLSSIAILKLTVLPFAAQETAIATASNTESTEPQSTQGIRVGLADR